MDPRIADYIRANRKKYTREVIREQLITAGHDPSEIDATWAALDAPDPDAVAGEGFWGRFWLFLVVLNVAIFLVVVVASGMLASITQGSFVLAVVLAIALAIGALMAWGIVAATGPARMGRTTAMVVGAVIPLVFALLVGGSCYALVASMGPPPPPEREGVMEVEIGPPLEFDASGSAFCQVAEDVSAFSIYSQEMGTIDGRELHVFISAFTNEVGPEGGPASAPGPSGEFGQVAVSVSLTPRSETDPPQEWVNDPGSEVSMDAAPDGLSGTITFDGLAQPEFVEPAAPGGEPISGTISWTCD